MTAEWSLAADVGVMPTIVGSDSGVAVSNQA